VRETVWRKVRSTHDHLKPVVLDLFTSPVVDLAGARMLAELHQALQAQGIRLRLVSVHAAVRDMLRAEGLEARVGYFGRRSSVSDVIEEFQCGTTPEGIGDTPG
jgi:sulfate permease, SulP family